MQILVTQQTRQTGRNNFDQNCGLSEFSHPAQPFDPCSIATSTSTTSRCKFISASSALPATRTSITASSPSPSAAVLPASAWRPRRNMTERNVHMRNIGRRRARETRMQSQPLKPSGPPGRTSTSISMSALLSASLSTSASRGAVSRDPRELAGSASVDAQPAAFITCEIRALANPLSFICALMSRGAKPSSSSCRTTARGPAQERFVFCLLSVMIYLLFIHI